MTGSNNTFVSSLLNQCVTDGEYLLSEIDWCAGELADMMAQVHGGDWGIRVNHNRGFILLVRRIEGATQ